MSPPSLRGRVLKEYRAEATNAGPWGPGWLATHPNANTFLSVLWGALATDRPNLAYVERRGRHEALGVDDIPY